LIRALAALALVLAVGDMALVLADRAARRELARGQQFIEQTKQLNRVNETLVKEIAIAAINDKDEKLRALLTQRGIHIDVYSPAAAEAANGAGGETAGPPPPPTPSASGEPAPPPGESAQHFVVRFDDRFAALTPASVRALDAAAAASGSGAPVRIEIDGCPAATHDGEIVCARRVASLSRLLAERGVANPKRLLAGNR